MRGGHVHVGDGTVLEGASVLIENGKISAVGRDATMAAPDGIRTIDARGKHVTPGLVEPRSALFLTGAERFDLGRTEARNVLDAIDPFDARITLWRAQGITTVGVAGGTSRGAGGSGAVFKLRRADLRKGIEASAMLVEEFSHYVAALGVSDGGSSTSAARLEQFQRLRDLFTRARDYERSWNDYWEAVEKYNKELAEYEKRAGEAKDASGGEGEKAKEGSAGGGDGKEGATGRGREGGGTGGAPQAEEESKDEKSEEKSEAGEKEKAAPQPPRPPRSPPIDLAFETVLRLLDQKRPIFVEAHRRDDLEFALLLAEEFGLNLVLAGATRAHELVERLATAERGVIVEPALLDGVALELRGHRESTAATLAAAGVPIALSASLANSGSELAPRRLRIEAAVAVRGGLPPEEALRAVTSAPAAMLGVGERVGTLAPGRDGDVVVFSGPPLDALSRVEVVAIDGFVVEESAPPAGSRGRDNDDDDGEGDGDGDDGAPDGESTRDDDWPQAPLGAPRSPLDLQPVRDAAELVLEGATVVSAGLAADSTALRCLTAGVVVVRDGKVVAVGEAGAVDIPTSAPRIDLAGRWLLPGFIDAHSHLGLDGEVDETSDAILEDLRVLDAFDPWEDDLALATLRGITTAAISPGSANVVGGEIVLLKLLSAGPRIRTLSGRAAMKVSLSPSYSLPRFPTAGSGAVAALAGWIDTTGMNLETLPLVVATDNLSALGRVEMAAERSPRWIVVEGPSIDSRDWRKLAVKPAGVILGPYGLGERAVRLAAAKEAVERGVRVAFATDGTRRDLLTTAVLAIQAGMRRQDALRALTRSPAELFGVDDRIGAIFDGADADLVVWSGDPFTLTARVEAVFIDGKLESAAEKPEAIE